MNKIYYLMKREHFNDGTLSKLIIDYNARLNYKERLE